MFRLMLDPGHAMKGNPYPGETNIFEGTQMWKLAQEMRSYIAKKYKNVQVGITKSVLDSNPSLPARAKMAAGWDLLYSLHSNANDNSAVTGTWMYYAIEASIGAESLRLAKHMATAVGKLFGHPSNRIGPMARALPGNSKLSYYSILRNGALYGAKRAVMSENGYHTNANDRKILANDAGIKRLAVVTSDALASYFGWQAADVTPTPQPTPSPPAPDRRIYRLPAGTEIRKEPPDVVEKDGHYTIVEVRNGWGRLLSGRGWVKLEDM